MALGWAAAGFAVFVVRPPCAIATLFHMACPSCGMTRALALAAAGDVAGSLRLHPLAVPALVATALVAVSTVRAAWATGNATDVRRDAAGRFAVGLAVVVYVASVALWAARLFGAFGGRSPYDSRRG